MCCSLGVGKGLFLAITCPNCQSSGIKEHLIALTNIYSLVTVGSSPSVSTAAAVVTAEVSITLTGAVEETDRPSFPIIPSVVRVLRPVRARVHPDIHTLPAPRAGATRVVDESEGRRAALSTPEHFGCHALSRELSAHHHRAREQQKVALKHHPKKNGWQILRTAAAELEAALPTEH